MKKQTILCKRDAGHAISRQPRALRDAVSRALVDGANWRKVTRICAAHGLPGVTAQNVTNYRQGAHKEWLAREERLEAARRDSETTAALVKHYAEAGGSPAEAGLLAAAEILTRSLSGLGPETLRQLVADDPKALFSVTRELARVAEMIAKRKAPETGTASAGEETTRMTPEQRAVMMREIFGLPG